MKIILTGATGFIGNYVVAELLKHNIKIVACGIEQKEEVPHDWLEKVTYIQANLNQVFYDKINPYSQVWVYEF